MAWVSYLATAAIASDNVSTANWACSSSTINGGERRIVEGPAARIKKPRWKHSLMMASRSSGAFFLVFRAFVVLTPIIRPRPRTLLITPWRLIGLSRFGGMDSPLFGGFARYF